MRENSVDVVNSKFAFLTSSTDGGAISMKNDMSNLFVSYSFFSFCYLPCSTKKLGGGIYFYSSNGYFVGTKLCGSNCAAYEGNLMFAYSRNKKKVIFQYLHTIIVPILRHLVNIIVCI